MSLVAKNLIVETHPHLEGLVEKLGALKIISRKKYSVPEAVARTVISQMLSTKAAATIRSRVTLMAESSGTAEISTLSTPDLLSCGVSRAKARAITEFRSSYENDPAYYERWRSLPKEILFKEVNECWGLSNWSAGILGIFYFSNKDIFPENDAGIARAIRLLEAKKIVKKAVVNPELCKPYRSYLALYLWRFLDDGLLD
jgi:DNA-3-methyladenine glycosylase II